jgi:hypothetical protein
MGLAPRAQSTKNFKTEAMTMHIVDDEQRSDRGSRSESFDMRSAGKTPHFESVRAPGRRMVGVEAVVPWPKSKAIDESTFPKLAFDAPEATEFGVSASGEMMIRKWYPVDIGADAVHPVAALFLKRGASWDDWERYYPKTPRFRISPAAREKFDGIIRDQAPHIPVQRYAQILRLLEMGGRVPMSAENDDGVFCVAHDGGLYATRPVRMR